jgi:hypothetical protein
MSINASQICERTEQVDNLLMNTLVSFSLGIVLMFDGIRLHCMKGVHL